MPRFGFAPIAAPASISAQKSSAAVYNLADYLGEIYPKVIQGIHRTTKIDLSLRETYPKIV